MATLSRRRVFLGVGIAVCVLVVVVMTPLTHYIVPQTLDFPWHIDAARSIGESGTYLSSHPVYQWLVLLAHRLLPGIDYTAAGLSVVVGAHMLLAGLLYGMFAAVLNGWRPWKAAVAAGLLALTVLIVGPITLIRPDHHRFWGFVHPSVYHSPTYLVLKPLALAVFWAVVCSVRSPRLVWVIPLSLFTVLATLTKPNYVLCLLPALVVFAVLQYRRYPRSTWLIWLVGPALPAGVVLAFQYGFTYVNNARSSNLVIAPFHFFAPDGSAAWIAPRLLASVLFPLLVIGLHREARRQPMLQLAWLSFLIGLAQALFLAEANPRGRIAGSANWLWGAEIALFILFVCSALFWLRRYAPVMASGHPRTYPRAFWWSALALLLHGISGLVWFSLHAAGGLIAWGQFW